MWATVWELICTSSNCKQQTNDHTHPQVPLTLLVRISLTITNTNNSNSPMDCT